MPSSTSQPEKLLYYIAANKVLICKECHYAIQPLAISGHLKVLHHIYRSDRQEFMKYTQSLDLAIPKDVVLPEPHEAPIPFLPTEDGLSCGVTGCGHLCASVKRMKSHWATVHRDIGAEPHVPQWRPVKLQTFFRGNQLRYFVVSESSILASQPQMEPEVHSECISPETGPPLADDSNWSADELSLIKYFISYTYFDMGHDSESRQMWQTAASTLAHKHNFLKHGLLAVSALHRASLDPSEKRRYQMIAAWHQNKALPEFRSEIAHPTEHNCNALLAFSQLLIIHCFASEEHDENLLLLVRGPHETGLPEWLQLIRGSCTIFEDVLQFLTMGPLKKLNEEMEPRLLADAPEDLEYNRRLAHLAEMPTFKRLPDPRNGPEGNLFPLPCALHELSRAFAKASAAQSRSHFTMWIAVYIWPAQISAEYLGLLKQRDPVALVLLAHYCILLKPLESSWYMNGFTKRLLSRIVNQLDQTWHQWLEWPLEEIGLQECCMECSYDIV